MARIDQSTAIPVVLSFSSVIYACITAFLTYYVLRLLSIPRWPALLTALTSPYWFGAVARLLGEVPWQWLAGLGLMIPYVLGPLLVRALSRWPASPQFEPWSPRDEPFPPRVAGFFDEVERALAREGYLPEIWLVQRGFVQHTTSRMRLFVNASDESAAIAYAIESDDPRASQSVSYIDVISYRRDGRHRITNNAPRPSPYPPIWYRELEVFPQVRDPARLVRLHRALARLDGSPAPLPDEIRQEPLLYAADVVRCELEHQVATGYLALNALEDFLRPTLWGAILMTWKMLPPASWVLAWRLRRRARALLAALDHVGADEEPLATPSGGSSVSAALLPITSAAAVLVAVAIFRLPELFGSVRLIAPVARSESFALPSGFAAQASFPDAVRQLESLAGAPSDTLFESGVPGKAARPTGGFAIAIRPSLASAFLDAVQPAFLRRGFYVLRSEQNFGIGGASDRMAILPTADPLEVVRRLGTTALAHGHTTADIVEWLRALRDDHPFALIGAGTNWIAVRLMNRPADAPALARRVYAFCPDVVAHGTGTVDALAREIARTRELTCWW